MKLAPIAFFAYRRPEHTLESLESLAQNQEAAQSELFIFCDGAKRPEDENAVRQVREVVRRQHWCGTVHIIERDHNWGLANSIIDGVTELCSRYGRVIVIEDDLVLSPFFLNFMNQALNLYEDELQVMQISGFMFPVEIKAQSDAVFLPLSSCWGWATWERAWKQFDMEMSGYPVLKANEKLRNKFDLDGYYPYFKMLERQIKQEVDSWGIRWYLSVFLKKGLVLFPSKSFVQNIGFDGSGQHHSTKSQPDSNFYNNHISQPTIEFYSDKVKSFPKSTAIDFEAFKTVLSSFKQGSVVSNKAIYFKNILGDMFTAAVLSFKKRVKYRLYLHISRLLKFGSEIDRERLAFSNTVSHPSVKFLEQATIDNIPQNSSLISISENSVIRGQLLIFPHSGKIKIGKDCYVGEGTRIWSADSIEIGDRVYISHNVNIHDTNAHSINPKLRYLHFMQIMTNGHPTINDVDMQSKLVTIEDDVWIGFNSTILKGVRIGKGAVVAACSVVTKDVPQFVIVAGNPAKIVKEIKPT